jgi:hypothetical protein
MPRLSRFKRKDPLKKFKTYKSDYRDLKNKIEKIMRARIKRGEQRSDMEDLREMLRTVERRLDLAHNDEFTSTGSSAEESCSSSVDSESSTTSIISLPNPSLRDSESDHEGGLERSGKDDPNDNVASITFEFIV